MMRINLLPDKERASLQAVQMGTLLFISTIVLVSVLSFATVYLRWQVNNAREQISGYQTTMAAVARYRSEMNKMQQDTKKLQDAIGPLQAQLQANRTLVDLATLLGRATSSAQSSNIWLRELSVQKDGTAPVSGYAVEFTEVSRFLRSLGIDPFNVVMGSTRWVERGGVKLLEFDARVGPAKGGTGK
jgi:Tfp pilus assembly protein PilN